MQVGLLFLFFHKILIIKSLCKGYFFGLELLLFALIVHLIYKELSYL